MKKKKRSKTVYFNEKQLEFAQAKQRIKVLIAGRGFGKSTEMALELYLLFREMPKAKGFLSSTTFEQIENNTLPAIREKWAELGLIEGVHYVVGKRPPESWAKPWKPVKKYDRVITFFNGFTIVLLSTERMNSRRGGSYDFGIIDEAAFVKFDAFKSVLNASIRGNLGRYPKHLHYKLIIITSRPRQPEGRWIYLFRELAKKNPEKVFYMEASAMDNVDALGAEWFEDMKASMGSEIEYLIEILNQDVEELPNGFYSKYRSHVHEYTPPYDVRMNMADIDTNALLEVSLDYGGWFSCFTVYQQDYERNEERLKRRYWIKEQEIEALVDVFCEAHKDHAFRYVRIWGEPRMWDRTAKGKVAIIVTNRFQEKGWECDIMAPSGYRTELHSEQYQFMLKVLTENDPRIPALRINRDACPDTITALKTADVMPDMTLDKKLEKKRDFPQELATHQPQTINYYFLQKHGDKVSDDPNDRPGDVDFG